MMTQYEDLLSAVRDAVDQVADCIFDAYNNGEAVAAIQELDDAQQSISDAEASVQLAIKAMR